MSAGVADEARGGCSVCGRSCRRPRAGSCWVLEWRIGQGVVASMEAGNVDYECEAVARTPSSALPGSYRKLFERRESGRLVVWLVADAQGVARHRLGFLARVVAALEQWTVSAGHEGDAALRKLFAVAAVEARCTRQSDEVARACDRLRRVTGHAPERSRSACGAESQLRAAFDALVNTVRAESQLLSRAWRGEADELAQGYERITSVIEQCELGCRARCLGDTAGEAPGVPTVALEMMAGASS